MNRSSQQLTRSLLGTILSSGLTDSELRGLARELRSGSLAFELADFLDTLLEQTARYAPPGSSHRPDPSDVGRAELAIKRRRLSKAILRELFELYAPASAQNRVRGDASVSELLRTFFENASDDDARRFVAALEAGGTDDPFLKGITERSKG